MIGFMHDHNKVYGWGILTNGTLAGGGWIGEYSPVSPYPAMIVATRREARDRLRLSKKNKEFWKDRTGKVVKVCFVAHVGW